MKPKELTIRGLVLGILLTFVFTAANVYLGLKVGLPFASSIRNPATRSPAYTRSRSVAPRRSSKSASFAACATNISSSAGWETKRGSGVSLGSEETSSSSSRRPTCSR